MAETRPILSAHESYPKEVPLSEEVITYWESLAIQQGAEALDDSPLFVHISGASGIGKLTAMKELEAYWTASGLTVRKPKSATTREFRNKDDYEQYVLLRYEDGEDIGATAARHRFQLLVKQGAIREYDTVPSKDGPQDYGTILDDGDLAHSGITLVETTIDALPRFKYGMVTDETEQAFSPLYNLISFYLFPPGETAAEMLDTIARWMARRPGETPESIHARLWGEDAVTPNELAKVLFGVYNVDYVVVNHEQIANEPLIAVNAIKTIVDRHMKQKQMIATRTSR